MPRTSVSSSSEAFLSLLWNRSEPAGRCVWQARCPVYCPEPILWNFFCPADSCDTLSQTCELPPESFRSIENSTGSLTSRTRPLFRLRELCPVAVIFSHSQDRDLYSHGLQDFFSRSDLPLCLRPSISDQAIPQIPDRPTARA